MWEKIDFQELVKDVDKFYAHKAPNRMETLLEHSERAFGVFQYILEKKDVKGAIGRAFKDFSISRNDKKVELSRDSIALIEKMFANTIYLHDIGKINPVFQLKKMDNDLSKGYSIPHFTAMENSNHSFLSSAIYLDIFLKETKKVKNPIERWFVEYVLLGFAFIIWTHHENLYNTDELLNPETLEKKMIEPIKNHAYAYFYKNTIDVSSAIGTLQQKIVSANLDFDGTKLMIVNKLLHSLLISSDFISTSQFFNDIEEVEFDLGLIENPDELFEIYKESEVYKGIKAYETNKKHFSLSPINALRSEMFLEAEALLKKDIDKNIFNLEMPTGAGKTNSSINLALSLLVSKEEYNKLFYIFPFNTLVEQTKKSFASIFEESLEFEAVNSIAPVSSKNYDTGDIDYTKTLLNRQILGYPAVFTSHVNLFRTMFGTGRQSSMPLFQLCNSVIVLDEIQTYRNVIWREIIEFLYKYSDILNMKIIIMSATLPNLQDLIGFKKTSFVNLIDNPQKYYQDKLFKDRVLVKRDLLSGKIDFHVLKKKIVESIDERNESVSSTGSMVLVEFIKKDTAKEFYQELIQSGTISNCQIVELTGDDNAYERERILQIIKSNKEGIDKKNIILVTTQIIEAGVDIDMDIGFKDTALLDNDEQFLGRINRSCLKKQCVAYFFNLDSEKGIYKDDLRLGRNLTNNDYFDFLSTKNFKPYYQENFDKINMKNDQLSNHGIEHFYRNVNLMKWEQISKHMELINGENTIQVFIPYLLEKETNEEDGSIKVEVINGEEVWKLLLVLLQAKDLSYSEKQIRFMNMRETINLFTFQVYASGILGVEEINSMFYIEKGSVYISNNKFNRKLFENNMPIIK